MPDQKWGEAVKAFVVLKDGVRVEAAELMAFVKEGAVPRGRRRRSSS